MQKSAGTQSELMSKNLGTPTANVQTVTVKRKANHGRFPKGTPSHHKAEDTEVCETINS